MPPGGDQRTAAAQVRRRLAIRADPDQVWAVAAATLHLPGWTLMCQPVPDTSPARLFLVRRHHKMRCSVSLLERRPTGAWSQDVVDLGTERVPYRIELERTRKGCRLAIEASTERRSTSAKEVAAYLHRWADTWLHSVDLIARGQLSPLTPEVSALDGYAPASTTGVVTSAAARLLALKPQLVWDRLTTVGGRPSGPLVHRVRLAPGSVRTGMRSLQASVEGGRYFAALTEVTECRPGELLTQRRLDGPMPAIASWQLQERRGGTLLTLEHTSVRGAQQDMELSLDRLVQLIGTE